MVIHTLDLLVIIYTLAPEWLLCIFPRLTDCSDNIIEKAKWDDFSNELKRTRDLVNRVPSPGPLRPLEYVTNRMSNHDKDEFRRLGNNLLVSLPNIDLF